MAPPQGDHIREMEDFKLANHTYRSVWKLDNMAEENDQSSNQQNHHVRRRTPDHDQQHHHHNDHHTDHSNIPASTSRNISNRNKNYTNSSTKSASWVNDPEVKRQRRVVKYKSYAVEGKMKDSLRNGFRWIKNKYCQFVHGY